MRRALTHLKNCDPVLAGVMERIGPFRMTYREPTFHAMARSIVFQQLAGKAAATIFQRLHEAAAGTGAMDGELTPAAVLALSDMRLRACGLSGQKLSYLRDLAQRTASGEIDFAALPAMSDDEVIEHLTRVKGIGVWSAQMFLMFALRRPDVMPTLDYGIQAGMQRAYRKRRLPRPAEMLKISRPWQPYRSFGCWYMWRFLELDRADAKARAATATRR